MVMTKNRRLFLLVIIDSLIVSFSIYMSHFFLNPYFSVFDQMIFVTSLMLLVTHHLFSGVLGMYRKKWRYANMEELVGLTAVITLSIVSTAILQFGVYGSVFERSLTVTWMLHVLLLGGVRFAWRYYNTYGLTLSPGWKKLRLVRNNPHATRTIIIGAGSAGQMLANQMKGNRDNSVELVGFIDDSDFVQGMSIAATPVLGKTEDIRRITEKRNIHNVVIAMPSIDRTRIREIIQNVKPYVKNVQTLPMIEDIAAGKVSVSHIRDVSIEDLLGREPVELNTQSIEEEIKGETVLVTGAGGSIGSELCRQLTKFSPKRIILLGHGEFSIYNIHMELSNLDLDTEFIPVIADVQDRERIFQVMQEYKPEYVYHAAAHKHVPLMEANPKEAVKNNVIGTKNVAEAADKTRVKTFVLVSTDKAVNPTNVMGATKRLAEMVIQSLDPESETEYVAVRFGNVLGSRGSVIPLFKKQIEAGGPVTVTDPEMTRYFMTIPEASRLVLQAGALARGGEIFVLDMGEPVKIVDLAKNLIYLSGFTEEEIPVRFSGIRPGEKMYEELLGDNEVHPEQIYPKIYVGKNNRVTNENIRKIAEQELVHLKTESIPERVFDLIMVKEKQTVSHG
ncbi:nucleoside-diphosphate sugar epimerase/dehydratase [Salimicrobium sp. PL1-032A]|uniref:polysaccharide biosynthesis protein n=1 Tax=Salimicrobium sp. PL1-032A TaxID=3095364 RepID=UPI00326014B0